MVMGTLNSHHHQKPVGDGVAVTITSDVAKPDNNMDGRWRFGSLSLFFVYRGIVLCVQGAF